MYDYIKGTISKIYVNYIVIENNGIGYMIHTANPYSFIVGEELSIYIYTHVKEDAYTLYGFRLTDERDLFLKLISVNGIGPKIALPIIAKGDIEGLVNAIEKEDVKYLQRFPGIGAKVSGMIILQLRGKLNLTISSDPKLDNVKEALKSLGYKNDELKKLDKFLIENKNLSIEELVKQSLKRLF